MANSLFIPDDIITDILSRISSVKSLLRFRCVCKSWKTKISSFSFIKMHLNHSSSKNDNYIFHSHETPKHYFDVKHIFSICSAETVKECSTFVFDLPYIMSLSLSIVGSCNGLLCLSLYFSEVIYFCNPATREVRRIHDYQIQYHKFIYTSLRHGFGFDPLIDDYKVVKIIYNMYNHDKVYGKPLSEVVIYRLSTNSWESIGDIAPEVKIANDSSQQLFNGSIYWMSELSGHQKSSVITFDLSNEVFQQIMLPDCSCEENIKLGVLWGCFSLLSFDPQNVTTEIWVMKEHSVLDCWNKQIVIKGLGAYGISGPLGFGNEGKVLMLKNPRYDLVWYDLKNQTIKGTDLKYEGYRPLISYVQSLVSVKSE